MKNPIKGGEAFIILPKIYFFSSIYSTKILVSQVPTISNGACDMFPTIHLINEVMLLKTSYASE